MLQNRFHHWVTTLSAVAVIALVAVLNAGAVEVRWDASTGLLPSEACPPWTHGGDWQPDPPSGGVLTLVTGECGQNNWYRQRPIVVPDSLRVEFQARLTRVGTCSSCGIFRSCLAVAITVAPATGTILWVAHGRIFLTTVFGCTSSVEVPLNTAEFHVYSILVVGDVVTVAVDGIPMLEAQTYTDMEEHGPEPRIVWGDFSIFAYGQSEWTYFRHNAHPTGCGACCVADICHEMTPQQCIDAGGEYQGTGTSCEPNPCHQTPTKATTWGRIRAGYR